MSLFSKKQNQKKRDNEPRLLDVNATTEQLWRRRRRLLMRLSVFSLLLISLAAAYHFGWPQVRQRIVDSNFFRISRIEVASNGGLTRDRLLQISGITAEDNLYDINLPLIRTRLESEPLIRSATLVKSYPGILKVRVKERIPVARVEILFPFLQTDGPELRSYLIDSTGMVMLAPEKTHIAEQWQKHLAGLPRIAGVDTKEFHMGRSLTNPKILTALEIIRDYAREENSRKESIEVVDVSQPVTVKVFTSLDTKLIFGLTNVKKQLHRWQLVMEKGKKEGLELESLDLSVQSNLPVQWRTNSPAGTDEDLTAAVTQR